MTRCIQLLVGYMCMGHWMSMEAACLASCKPWSTGVWSKNHRAPLPNAGIVCLCLYKYANCSGPCAFVHLCVSVLYMCLKWGQWEVSRWYTGAEWIQTKAVAANNQHVGARGKGMIPSRHMSCSGWAQRGIDKMAARGNIRTYLDIESTHSGILNNHWHKQV